MATHFLKTWPEYFGAIVHADLEYKKTFEVRKNDRNFQVGDWLILAEYNPDDEKFPGDFAIVWVSYILSDGPRLQPGYCVMGIINRLDFDYVEHGQYERCREIFLREVAGKL